MSVTITIKTETAGGKLISEIPVPFANELTTVREIILNRVHAEVENYNNKSPEYFQGLVQPTNAEQTLNGYKLREYKKIDPEKQLAIALDAFETNGFFVLIDNIQAASLDQMVVVNERTQINFVKLTPLVGG